MKEVVVTGSFDDIQSRHIRFLEEAAKRGQLHVLLWSDDAIHRMTGQSPKFGQEERKYFVEAVRYVDQVTQVDGLANPDEIPLSDTIQPQIWIIMEKDDKPQKRAFCAEHHISFYTIPENELDKLPVTSLEIEGTGGSSKKVVVTGCFDWLHTGHVRFFEETSKLGDLFVVLGHDENVYHLKGEGHPLFSENERRYMVQAIRYVKQALVSSGHGWMDAEPEIARIQADIYAVNEDGDKPEKRAFCEKYGLDYVVLKRLPKEGLPRRESTALRGF